MRFGVAVADCRAFAVSAALIAFVLGRLLVADVLTQAAIDADDVVRSLDGGRYAEARDKARELLAVAERQSGPSSLDATAAIDLLVESLLLDGEGGSPETVALANRSLAVQRQLRGPPARAITALNNLGALHSARGEYADAVRRHEEALRLLQGVSGGNDVARAFEGLALALIRMERFDDALSALRRAQPIREAAATERRVALATTLELVASAYRYKADFDSARVSLDRAVTVWSEIATSHPARISLLHLAGDISFLTGDMGGARRSYGEALVLAQRTLRAGHPSIGVSLRKLGVDLIRIGGQVG